MPEAPTLFDAASAPRVFGLPAGVDFPAQLARGLRDRMHGHPPEAMARVTVFVNAARMRDRLREAFDTGPAALLPRIRLVTDLADPAIRASLPTPVPPLRRRLELSRLVDRLIRAEPDLAPRSALYGLSDSLAALLEEMQTEGIAPDALRTLDVSDQSGHWQRALRFLDIVQHFVENADTPDRAGHARGALDALMARWEAAPPADPVLVAGSTGSRGTTQALMRAVATLPQGALVLPGFDFDMPLPVWAGLGDPLAGEDHPQYRFAALLSALGVSAGDVARWTNEPAPAPTRNAAFSMALRPAPVTHQWRNEGPGLPDLPTAMADVTLLEAGTPRDEARIIALRLRAAAEAGETAALISPDRMLTRQVTAALDRWGIVPDDSAGIPAQLTAPGRFLRHVAQLRTGPATAEALLTLLKHPLTHSGLDRGPHLLATRALELHIRANGWAYPDAGLLRAFADHAVERAIPGPEDWNSWTEWAAAHLCPAPATGTAPLADHVAAHRALAEAIAAGPIAGGAGAQETGAQQSGRLWHGPDGAHLHRIVQSLADEAAHGTDMDARDYAQFLSGLLADHEVPDPTETHPGIRIWGTLEARAMGADLLILGGLNEGSWPAAPKADPWLNRAMRAEAGLLIPDRQTGLSAHDFQIAAAARRVWLTRAVKSDDAETVPSRWLNRLINMLGGLRGPNGPEALDQMRARGRHWVQLADLADTPIHSPKAQRPAPQPPVEDRPKALWVTQIRTLVRDPYAIYAQKILRLKPLDPLMRAPDALLRGILVHDVLDHALAAGDGPPDADALRAAAAEILGDPARLPFPTARLLWQASFDQIAEWFAETEAERQATATPRLREEAGASPLAPLDFTLKARLDRLDIDAGGRAHLFDYKTGAIPTRKMQENFDKQLLLTAAMLERGGFEQVGAVDVARAAFIGLSPANRKVVDAPLDDLPPAEAWAGLARLIAAYAERDKGYTARRALLKDEEAGRYDHLARFGEWDVTDPASPERVG